MRIIANVLLLYLFTIIALLAIHMLWPFASKHIDLLALLLYMSLSTMFLCRTYVLTEFVEKNYSQPGIKIKRKIQKLLNKDNLFTLTRINVSNILTNIEGFLILPITLIIQLNKGKHSPRTVPFDIFLLSQSVKPVVHLQPLYCSILLFFLYVLDQYILRGNINLILFIYIIGAAVFIRLINYAINPEPIWVPIKRLYDNPKTALLIIFLSDLLSLAILSTVITGIHNLESDYITPIIDSVIMLLSFRDALDLIGTGNLIPSKLLIYSLGLLYYVSIGRFILKLAYNKKNDKDRVWIANYKNRLGDYEGALKEIKNVSDIPLSGILEKTVSFLGKGEINNATATVIPLLQETGQKSTEAAKFSILMHLTNGLRIRNGTITKLFLQYRDIPIPDYYMAQMVNIVYLQRQILIPRVYNIVRKRKCDYPMAMANFLLFDGRLREAVESLEEIPKSTGISELFRQTSILIFLYKENSFTFDHVKAFNSKLTSNKQIIQETVSGIPNGINCNVAYGLLHAVLSRAKDCKSLHESFIANLCVDLEKRSDQSHAYRLLTNPNYYRIF